MTMKSCDFTSSSMSLKDSRCGGASISLRARHHRGGLGQPGRKPERLDLALHLVARAGAAVIAVEGRGLQEKRLHHRACLNRFRTGDKSAAAPARPQSGFPANAPSRRTATPQKPQNSTDPAPATARRDRHRCAKIPSMRYLRNSRAAKRHGHHGQADRRKSSKIAAIRAQGKRKCNDAAQMPGRIDAADGAGPAQFMAEQFPAEALGRGMADAHGGNGKRIAPRRARPGRSHNRRPDNRRKRQSRRSRPARCG